MEFQEIKDLIDNFEKTSFDEKLDTFKFITGVSLVIKKENFLFDLLKPETSVDDVYNDFVDAIKNSNYFNADEIVQELEKHKELLQEAHQVYVYKAELSRTVNPMDFVSFLHDKPQTNSISFPLMVLSMLNMNRCINTGVSI